MIDFFIPSADLKICMTGSDCSLPVLLRMNQYINKSEGWGNKLSDGLNGYMGYQSFDYDVQIKYPDSTNSLKWLKTRVYNNNNQVIQKTEIFSKFLVIEIPDYSAQSKSPFFSDFVPQIESSKEIDNS